jgi:hypothetical protein
MTMKERRSRTIKSRIRELPKQGDGTRALVPRTTVLPRHLEDRRVKTLVRSLSVLDEWLEQNEGRTNDEVRVRRIKGWREEVLEQLRLSLNLARS